MSEIFLTSDTHFNHLKLGHGPQSTERYIRLWNALVRPEDTVVHLVDVIFSKAGTLTEIMNRLNGTKILVRGNHDKKSSAWYEAHGFALCCDRLRRGKFIFTHKPMFWVPWGRINVHGHLHTRAESHRKGGRSKRHYLIESLDIVRFNYNYEENCATWRTSS